MLRWHQSLEGLVRYICTSHRSAHTTTCIAFKAFFNNWHTAQKYDSSFTHTVCMYMYIIQGFPKLSNLVAIYYWPGLTSKAGCKGNNGKKATQSRDSLARPDPYTGGEGLVTCYTRSCTSVSYRPAPIRLQLFDLRCHGHARVQILCIVIKHHAFIEMIGKRTLRHINM